VAFAPYLCIFAIDLAELCARRRWRPGERRHRGISVKADPVVINGGSLSRKVGRVAFERSCLHEMDRVQMESARASQGRGRQIQGKPHEISLLAEFLLLE
jgi:hypothetical protein